MTEATAHAAHREAHPMSTVYITPPRKGRRRRPTLFSRLVAQFRYVMEVGW